ncbi:MAG: methylmalonyl Co-A mutase-associated GTPase MeaB [Flavobacteriales bacterium]|nr:methylmalonyl Co-A mutase-associated GTPase MeaB [Flavobacteriales bacterium]
MDLFKEILKGNKVALAKGITLLESSLETDIISSQELISNCLPHSGDSIRIGITGIPGVGKSTFIETFGKILTEKGKKVAVLAIDPTSEKTHGSILGDKSRMNKLAVDENAFIRPSPSSGTLGGVSSKTRDSIILCEAAGFDVILIETVGVGQSETIVNTICDFFLLLMLAGAGDELQGIKRGIMELADMVVITKSDGDNLQKANNAKQEYQMALHLFPASENGWTPKVSVCSALEDTGIKDIWETISTYNQQMISNNYKYENRKKQDVYWLHHIIKEDLGNKKYNSLILEGKLDELETKLKKGGTIKQLLEGLSIY